VKPRRAWSVNRAALPLAGCPVSDLIQRFMVQLAIILFSSFGPKELKS
jgi:hypothetical protein